jgi:tRNA dimethylallyltransferase
MPASPASFADAFLITGPTGSGKTAVALELATRWNAEIIAADSMTLYRGMDIGTAKPSVAERQRVPHHLMDVLDPWESSNVAWWLDRAAEACEAIRAKGKLPLFVGGTPFYLKALMCGIFNAPPSDATLRAELEAEDKAVLHAKLSVIDPVTAKRLHVNDVRRVVRALEVFHLTGQPISALQQTWNDPQTIPGVVLTWPREVLYERINQRVDNMLDAGWIDEVARLQTTPMGAEAGQALGYRELAAVLRGERSLAEVREEIQTRTRQFAKRQMTWFRSLPHLKTLSAEDAKLLDQIEQHRKHAPAHKLAPG